MARNHQSEHVGAISTGYGPKRRRPLNDPCDLSIRSRLTRGYGTQRDPHIGDVRNAPNTWRDRLHITEQKTGKTKDFPLSASAKKALATYLATRPEAHASDPLFPSRKHGRPLQRGQAWQLLREAAQAVGVTDPVGTHTLRKTFGYHAYQSGVDLAVIQQILNHSSPGTTLAYIGIRREDRDAVYLGLNL